MDARQSADPTDYRDSHLYRSPQPLSLVTLCASLVADAETGFEAGQHAEHFFVLIQAEQRPQALLVSAHACVELTNEHLAIVGQREHTATAITLGDLASHEALSLQVINAAFDGHWIGAQCAREDSQRADGTVIHCAQYRGLRRRDGEPGEFLGPGGATNSCDSTNSKTHALDQG